MIKIDSGNGNKIPLISLIAILSISLTVNLPGLAVSPILAKLHSIFPSSSMLETQMLTSLPNLVIIPFILLSGKLAKGKLQTLILALGLIIFTAAGILYFFANSMIMLILLGCLVGVGCGLVIPLAASMIALYFSGRRDVWALGLKSGTSNAAVIIATLFVGWVAAYNWHLSFIVYLVPVIPLLLVPFMTPSYVNKNSVYQSPTPTPKTTTTVSTSKRPLGDNGHRMVISLLLGVIGLYIICTYATIAVSYSLPFAMEHYGFDSGAVGVATAMFYLSATLAGFTLPYMMKICKGNTILISIAISGCGLGLVCVFHTMAMYVIGIFLTGYGYGIIQPIIYDKTTAIAPNKNLANQYFAYVLTGNYIAISCAPFFIKLMKMVFGSAGESPNFAFVLNASIMGILLIVGIILRHKYVFSLDPTSYTAKHKKTSSVSSGASSATIVTH